MVNEIFEKNNDILEGWVSAGKIGNNQDIIDNIQYDVYDFYHSYYKMYQDYYGKVILTKSKLQPLIWVINRKLIEILKGYIMLLNYYEVTPEKINTIIDENLEKLGLSDSDYYTEGDIFQKLSRLSSFIAKPAGYTVQVERKLMDVPEYPACNSTSIETMDLVKIIITEMGYTLWVLNLKQNSELILNSLITLFGLFNLLHMDTTTLTRMIHG